VHRVRQREQGLDQLLDVGHRVRGAVSAGQIAIASTMTNVVT